MSIMKMSIIGLETALQRQNESVFDLLNLPDGIDKDTLTDNILLEASDFEVLYPDPHFFRAAVGTWSNKHYRTFEKWITALNIEYNPLENYDRVEEWTDTGNEKSNTKGNTSSNEDTTGSVGTVGNDVNREESSEKGKVITDSDTENSVSAYDSGSYQPADKTESDTSEDRENNILRYITNDSKQDVNSNSNVKGNTSNNEDFTKDTDTVHKGRIRGNIGVTTSQMMLQSELDIARFNIVQQITDLFLTEFCLMIYT